MAYSAIPIYNATNDINKMKDYQKQAGIADLQKARDSSLSNLGAEQKLIQPQYYKAREQASTASQLGSKNLAEFMANRGQASAGASVQGELNRNFTMGKQLGDLQTGELNANNDINRRTTDLNNGYNSDVASSNANVEANGLQAMIQANQTANAQQIDQNNTDRTYNYGVGRDVIADKNYATETAYNQNRDTVSDRNYATETAYNKSRDTIGDTRYANETAYNRQQTALAQARATASAAASRAKATGGSAHKLTKKEIAAKATAVKVGNIGSTVNSILQDGGTDNYDVKIRDLNSIKSANSRSKAIVANVNKAIVTLMKRTNAKNPNVMYGR
jgi:hypothetical protein